MYGRHIYPEWVHHSGITGITTDDVEYAENAGYSIKLIGSVNKIGDDKLGCMVCPRLVPKSNLLASVDDVYNAISVTGDGVGDVLFYGRGAGKLPTASAVVGDMIDCLKHQHTVLAMSWEDSDSNDFLVPYKQIETAMYVRVKIADAEQYKAKLSDMFGGLIFIERANRSSDELAFITPVIKEADIDEGLKKIAAAAEIASKIRVL